jgi:hypothetical protein
LRLTSERMRLQKRTKSSKCFSKKKPNEELLKSKRCDNSWNKKRSGAKKLSWRKQRQKNKFKRNAKNFWEKEKLNKN